MAGVSVQERFTAALNSLVEHVKQDRSILAAILCGSLAHDVVWTKSDIDLLLVTIDEKKAVSAPDRSVALYAAGVNVHAWLVTRTEFRKLVEGSVHHSFMHSLLAKGRLVYTHDESIAHLCERLTDIGARDRRLQLLGAATAALPPLYKAHKWLVTRGDLEYTALWILYAATPLAEMELIAAGRLVDREVIPQAVTLNPEFFNVIYRDLLNGAKTRERVRAALDAADAYVAARAPALFAPVIDHLREVGEARSSTEIETHFERNFGIRGVTTACEYLADQGLIGKASAPVRLTRKSSVDVQELAFFYLDRAKGIRTDETP